METDMAEDFKVDLINPFLMATSSVMRDVCRCELKVGKPYVRSGAYNEDTVMIMIGLTGELRGQVMLTFARDNALWVVSKMAMMDITEMNELAVSAISELGNMIMGNAATILSTKGIVVDITPPTFCQGAFKISTSYTKNVCVPLMNGDTAIMELVMAIKGEEND